ncbi:MULTISPECIES: AEC family transporter [unclassified Pseudomonas]|uniref:AEC family transporter n=1 Tax=unclassified Pseudomonas TaxID=196821 RepID=UPI00131AAA79|nr:MULTISPECIES: AEC family transporter [unclassified Pseudomonas]
MSVPQTILPVFLLIILGYVLARRNALDSNTTKTLGNLAFKLFMPMVLFTGMLTAPLHDGLAMNILVAYFVPTLIVFSIVNLVAHAFLKHPSPFGLTAAFGNNALIGIPMVAGVFGNGALVLVFTVLAVHSLLLFSFQSLYNTVAGSEPFKASTLIASLANPMIVGLLLGVTVNLTNLSLPGWGLQLTHWLAQAALPCALIVLGANLSGYRLRPDLYATGITAAKLFLLPLLVLLSCIAMGIDGIPRGVLVLMAANPSGVNVLGFARSLEDSRKASSAICLSTLLSALTLPLWMWINACV